MLPRDFTDIFESFFDINFNPKTFTYPPYNLVKTEFGQVLELAVAGFTKNELTVAFNNATLVIEGLKKDDERTYSYKGLASRSFKNSFRINPNYALKEVKLSNGILSVEFEKVQDSKEQTIEIKEV